MNASFVILDPKSEHIGYLLERTSFEVPTGFIEHRPEPLLQSICFLREDSMRSLVANLFKSTAGDGAGVELRYSDYAIHPIHSRAKI